MSLFRCIHHEIHCTTRLWIPYELDGAFNIPFKLTTEVMSRHSYREAVEEVIAELVRIETENPPGNEGECSRFIAEWFKDHGIEAHLVGEPYPSRPQSVAHVGEGDPTIVLNGHTDVVPAGDPEEWIHDPYAAEIEDGKLYGRGSVDMKAGLAIAMLAAVSLREPLENGDLNGSIVVHAAIGEETGDPGTKTLLETGYDGDYGVVLEPTELRTATSVKGLLWYDITIQGNPAHASQPNQGSNALLNTLPVIQAFREYDEQVQMRNDDLVGNAHATLTQFSAGVGDNKAVIPGNATLTIDRRILPSESVADVDEEIASILGDVVQTYNVEAEWTRSATYESAAIPTDSNLATAFRDASYEIADISRDPWGITVATDTRNFINDAGMPAITWGPGNINQAHTRGEYVDLDEVATGAVILEQALKELLS